MALPIDLSGSGFFRSAGAQVSAEVSSRFASAATNDVGTSRLRAGEIASALTDVLINADNVKSAQYGGISLNQVRSIYKQARRLDYAKKGFFYIEVSSPLKPNGDIGVGTFRPAKKTVIQNDLPKFDMMAIDVSYDPTTLSGDAKRIGSATIDQVDISERTELKITTMDDTNGTMKKWFRELASRVADSSTGTFGLPVSYATDFAIYHAVVAGYNDPSGIEDSIVVTPYRDAFRMRPTSISFELSRTDKDMQQISMTFTQMDTFMVPSFGALA